MKQDERFMKRALALAARGGAKVHPNPRVGCVIVNNGRIVGEGFHRRFGGPHAEIEALRDAGRKARGAAAYVTLEPCCHTNKKSSPCVPALIRSGIDRIVVGTRDSNPEVSGRGLRLLKEAGIDVASGVLESKCRTVNRRFLSNAKKARPYVILKAAASLDGRIETAGGESKWITSPESRRASHKMRAEADAVLAGIETVLKDDPALTAHGAGRNPVRVILDCSLRTPRSAKVLNGQAPTIIMTSEPRALARDGRKLGNAHLIHVARNVSGLDLRQVLRRLSGMGIGKLLVEGGSAVHTSFLQAGLVDEVRLFIAPKLIGGAAARGFFEGRGAGRLRLAKELSGVRVQRMGRDILVTGYL